MWNFFSNHMFTLSYRWQQGKKDIRFRSMNLFAEEESQQNNALLYYFKIFLKYKPFYKNQTANDSTIYYRIAIS